MRTLNFWRTLFFSALAVTAFAACSDDDDDKNGAFNGEPSITVNGAASAVVGHDYSQGTTAAVTVESAGPWTMKADDEANMNWVRASALGAGGGKTMLTFEVGPATADREGSFTLTATGSVYGVPITKTAKIIVRQTASGSVNPETNVAAIRTLLKAMNPTKTKVAVTDEIAAMTLTGVVVSDFNGNNFGNQYNVAVQDSETAPNSGLTLNANTFPALKLTPGKVVTVSLQGAQVNTYGGVIQVAISNDVTPGVSDGTAPAPVPVTPDKLLDYESQLVQIDECYPAEGVAGQTWNNEANEGNVNFVTLKGQAFVVRTGKSAAYKDAVIPEKSGTLIGIGGQFNGDVQLQPRNAQDLAGLDQPIPEPDYTVSTIKDLAAGQYKVENATIVGVHSKGVMFAQETSGSVYYVLGFNNEWADQSANPYQNDVDNLATVQGTVIDRYGLLQFSNFDVTVGGISSLALPAPVNFDAAAIEEYTSKIAQDQNNSEYKYVKLTGVLDIEPKTGYNSYTLGVTGVSNVVVTLAYGLDSYYDGLASGDVVNVYGFALGFDGTKLNILLRSIEKNLTTPAVTFTNQPAEFAGRDAQPQTINYTFENTTAAEIVFSIEGTNADKFGIGEKTDAHVVVSALGNNESDAAYTAQLVAKVGGATVATADLTQAVAPAAGQSVVEIDFAAQDWANATAVTTVEQSPITLDFSKGSNTSNAPKYYTSGTAVRLYAGNTMQVTGATIVKIEFTFVSGKDNFTSVSAGTLSEGVWMGSANDITFTSNPDKVNDKFLQTHIQKMRITYQE